jgi:putative ABC transport system permease protein
MPDFREEIRSRLATLRIAPAREAEIVDELAQHLEDEYRDALTQGLSETHAHSTALATMSDHPALARALAGTGRVRTRQAVPVGRTTGSRLANLWQDLRFGARMLARRPAFTAAVVLLVALGIAATATIFSVVDAVLLKPLPFPESDRLMAYWGTAPDKGLPEVDQPDGLLTYQRQHVTTVEPIAAYDDGSMTLTDGGEPARIDGAWITYNLFSVLRLQPALGRTFTQDEERPNGGLVVILSDALWRERFGGDSGVVGRAIRINDLPTTVVGVMPPGVEFPGRSRLWIPLRLTGNTFNCWCFQTIARLRDGQTVETARQEISRLSDDLAISRPDLFPNARPGGSRYLAEDLTTRLAGDVRTPLVVLLAAVGLVLFIGCANVANLLLARAAQRTRELALRCALGASVRRIRSQLITEATLVLVIGLVTGLVVTSWALRMIRTLPNDRIPRVDEVALDPAVVFFGIGTAIIAGLVFAVVPAVRASRVDLQSSLRDGTRGSGGTGHRRTADAFVVVQLALSLVLLSGAGLMIRSFRNLMEVDTGYRIERVLTARFQPSFQRYPNDTLLRQFVASAIERIAALPGVVRVGAVSRPPLLRGNPQDNIIAEGKEPRGNEPTLVANIRYATPGYFDAVGTPILRGRGFNDADVQSAPTVAIVDESLVRRYWPNENPIGKRIRHGGDPARNRWMTIVGVVPNIKHTSLDEDASLQVYEAFEQRWVWTMHFVVRTVGTPETIIPSLRSAIGAIDPTLPLFDVTTLEQALDRTLMPRRLTNGLLTGFALAAVLLAAIGIYGVMALNVNGRLREFGVRLALGAAPTDVLRMVLGAGTRLALIGIAVGTVASYFLTPLLRDLLFHVPPRDVLTMNGVAVLLGAVTLLACYVPARRAMRADPTDALRTD